MDKNETVKGLREIYNELNDFHSAMIDECNPYEKKIYDELIDAEKNLREAIEIVEGVN